MVVFSKPLDETLDSRQNAIEQWNDGQEILKGLGVDHVKAGSKGLDKYKAKYGDIQIVWTQKLDTQMAKIMLGSWHGLKPMVRGVIASMDVGRLVGDAFETILPLNQFPTKGTPLYRVTVDALASMLAWAVTERSYGNSEKILQELNTEGKMLDAKKEVGVKRRLAEIPTMAIDSKEMGEALGHLEKKPNQGPKCGGCNKSTCQYFSVTIRRCCG